MLKIISHSLFLVQFFTIYPRFIVLSYQANRPNVIIRPKMSEGKMGKSPYDNKKIAFADKQPYIFICHKSIVMPINQMLYNIV